jgi:hypothetical protein
MTGNRIYARMKYCNFNFHQNNIFSSFRSSIKTEEVTDAPFSTAISAATDDTDYGSIGNGNGNGNKVTTDEGVDVKIIAIAPVLI